MIPDEEMSADVEKMTYTERMISVTNVAWGRKPMGGFWVTWDKNGEPQTRNFITAHGAQQFAQWLDTTGQQVTARDVSDVENSIRELEKTLEATAPKPDPGHRRELAELGAPIPSPRKQRKAARMLRKVEKYLGTVPVRRHARRVK